MEGAIARQSPTERTQAMRISRIQEKKKVKMKMIRQTVISQRMVTKVSQSSPRQS